MKALFPVLTAVVLLSVTNSASAQSFRELMEDIGLQAREKHKMDFSERAPLVIPPSTDALPPPEDATAPGAVNPNWPTDPEVAKALEEAEEENTPQHLRRKYQEDPAKDIYKIRAQERAATEQAAATKPHEYDTIFDRNVTLSPKELQAVKEKRAATPEVNVYVEPERKRLTDPPTGYRTPSAAQPYGPGETEKKKGAGWFSKINPFD